jgi:hypothetical protein
MEVLEFIDNSGIVLMKRFPETGSPRVSTTQQRESHTSFFLEIGA